jgi:hypothetical protein
LWNQTTDTELEADSLQRNGVFKSSDYYGQTRLELSEKSSGSSSFHPP